MIFQVELEVACAEGFVPRPNVSGENKADWDDKVSDLQFRDRCEFAVGHNVATTSDSPAQLGGPTTRVRTTWIPTAEVRRVKAHSEKNVTVGMDELALLTDGGHAERELARLPEAYGEWIAKQRAKEIDVAGSPRAETQAALMDLAQEACDRIRLGIKLVAEDAMARRAFVLTNHVMASSARRRKPDDFKRGEQPQWRLFQLAFVLANLVGLTDDKHADRDRVELIFFPTGGGKTEAYLGVIAYALVLRRLRRGKSPDGGLGVAVLLRYTLRLLTLDQLDRAATLVCALESERKKTPAELGEVRFSVGLWVGRSATANTLEEVAKAVSNFKIGSGPNPFPLAACPWCRVPLKPSCLELRPKTSPDEVRVTCFSETCEFAGVNSEEGLPVVFVDEQVYRELPSFLIATVDKFAMMPWRGEVGMLFGKATAREGRRFYGPLDGKRPKTARPLHTGLLPPELIVQDELHLISGPLGTMVGLYETAIDTLCTRGVRPKVIAATATVRRAQSQVQALFGRRADQLSVFPPPGIDDSQTYFSEVDWEAPGRLYVGVAAQGRTMKRIAERAYRALLAAAERAYDDAAAPDQEADGMMTLVGYFNSLRELGGMRRLVEDEVRERAKKATQNRPRNEVGPHRWFRDRDIGLEPVELTSREHTGVVKAVRDRLSRTHKDPEAIQVLLASNMISVGVDIDRLGLMVVAGQPKTTAEYIQASSRVGRSSRWPGLVVTLYNLHKPRDRSHYEHFCAYHESFYRYVEATSVTPFSGPALDRGLAGVLVSMIRFGHPDLTPARGVMLLPAQRAVGDAAVHALAARARAQPASSAAASDQLGAEIEKMGANLLDHWANLVTGTKEQPAKMRYSPFDREKTGGPPLLLTTQDRGKQEPEPGQERFEAPTSMREVEDTAHLWHVGRRFTGGGA